jgi:hypothetical protein
LGGQDFASFATGLSGAYLSGLLEDRKREQDDKNDELVRQLAAYHALMEHPDTPESDIPDILDAQAKLLKDKNMGNITAHMRESMKRQVPYGPEKETAGSISDRISARGSGIPESTMELPNSIAMRPYSDAIPLGTGQGRGDAVPLGGGQPIGRSDAVPLGGSGSTFTVTRPALLPRVPEEPRMYQPTREYGSLTQGEATDIRKGNLYADQQEEMTKRLLKVQGAADEDRARREAAKAEAARKQEELRQQGRIAVVQKTYDEKRKTLPFAAQAKTESERIVYRNSLMAGGMPEHDADVASFNLFRAQVDTQLAGQKQKIEESKERMKRMGVLNSKTFEDIRKIKDTRSGLYGGMTAGTKREFDLRTGTLQNEMSSVLRQLEVLYKKRDDEGPDSVRQETIDALENQKAELWTNIDAARNEILGRGVPTVPGAPTQRAGGRYNVPLSKYGLQ